MSDYDVTAIRENFNQAVRDIIAHCAVATFWGKQKQAASDLGMSTHTVNVLASFLGIFGSRDDAGIEPLFPFLLNPQMFTAIMDAPDPKAAHEAAMAEGLTPAQIRQRFPAVDKPKRCGDVLYKTTIIEPELTSGGQFRAFADQGDSPPEQWPPQATMTIREKKQG